MNPLCQNGYVAYPLSNCCETLQINDLDSDDLEAKCIITNSLGNKQILDCTILDGTTVLDLTELPKGFLSNYKLYDIAIFAELNSTLPITYNTDYDCIIIQFVNTNPIITNEFIR
jgi:hypothetical protein